MSSNKKQLSAVKPYCKVCHDAGKSEKEYTSHFVKSAPGPEGKVVCPTLLCQSCGYCGDCGHTPKFCPTLAAQKAAEEKALKQAARKETMEKSKATPKPGPVKAKSSNVFAALDSDSETECEPKVRQREYKPVTNVTIKKPAAKLVAKEDECPALSAVSQSAAKYAVKPATKGKPQFLEALSMTCPGLKVATKMPEVNTYRPPIAQLVRKKPQEAEAEAEAEAEDEYEEPDPSDFTMADFYQRAPMKASEMDWAMTEDSDDEDW
jgi:hypothetical protein